MNILNSELSKNVLEFHETSIGNIYLFENLVVTEIKESVHIDCEKSKVFLKPILKMFGRNKPFGFVSNRINNYSIQALDLANINKNLPNLVSFSSVIYSYVSEMNTELEKQFCKIPYNGFKNITEAYTYVNEFVLKKSVNIA